MRLRKQILTENDCFKTAKTIIPKGVMVHSTGSNNPNVSRYVPGDDEIGCNRYDNHWNRTGMTKCVHAFVGKFADGGVGIVQTLPWNWRGWHAGGAANNTHISFEICEDGLTDASYFSAVYQEAVELTAYLCKEFSLDPMADGVIICHQEGYQRGVASNHADVLHWFPKMGKTMDDFRADVARAMRGGDTVTQEQFNKMMDAYLAQRNAQPADDWAKPYIQEAIDVGLMADVGGTIASPKGFVTRQELAVVAVNAAKK